MKKAFLAGLAIAGLVTMSASAQVQDGVTEVPEAEETLMDPSSSSSVSEDNADEASIARDLPDTSDVELQVPVASGEIDWAALAKIPNAEAMAERALAPAVNTGDSTIMMIQPPAGFDNAAYVVGADSVGYYLIDNVLGADAAVARAKVLEQQVAEELNVVLQETGDNSATRAVTYVPTSPSPLSIVNVIVAPDLSAGNTVTLAFTYDIAPMTR